MHRSLPPSLTLVAVTALLVPFGQHTWSWLAGPIGALVVWELGRPAEPAPAHAERLAPEPVD